MDPTLGMMGLLVVTGLLWAVVTRLDRHTRPAFCEVCGKPIVLITFRTGRFDKRTGKYYTIQRWTCDRYQNPNGLVVKEPQLPSWPYPHDVLLWDWITGWGKVG